MSKQVRDMFDAIAPRYDRANVILSLGQHQRWRTKLVKLSRPRLGDQILDVATGTGDLAFLFKSRVGDKGHVIGLDFSEAMLDVARRKEARREMNVEFRHGDALRLPFKDAEFDIASIAFGIRNVDDPQKGIKELARVVRPGGRVAVLEFGQPGGLLGPFYRLYSRVVIPSVGGTITGQKKAYKYLDRTAASFPAGQRFLDLMESTAAFQSITTKSLSGGIVYAYVGTVASAKPR
jgi:demethylmenaquinone methyltransferase/2-methoxy-6-polyprenyl-1,4-benzoquinol methylase